MHVSDKRNIAVLIGSSLAWREQVMRGIASFAHERGNWHVFSAPEGEEQRIFSTGGYRWDGLIIRPAGPAFLRRVTGLGVPVVSVGSIRPGGDVPRVKVNDIENTGLILRHLLSAGLRNFGYVSPFPAFNAEDRGPAFVANVKAAGHECRCFNHDVRIRTSDTWQMRLKQLIRWLKELPKPVGIATYNPDMACQVVDACNRAGIPVPDDVAVIASDDDPMKCELSQPTVSAAEISATRIGYEAARLLEALISGKPAPQGPVELPPTGVIAKRQSTAIVNATDREVQQAADLIRQNCHKPFDLGRFADELRVSPRWLQRHFQRVLKCSPSDYHRTARVEQAKRLLLETDWPASRIAEKTGFHSPSHFNRVIREETGQTPVGFRAKFRL